MRLLIAAALFLFACCTPCFADIVWSEDFESATVNDSLADIGGPWSGAAGSYSVRDFGTPFGATNQWLQMQAFGDPWTFTNNSQTGITLATLSFDIFDPTIATGNDGYVRVALSGDAGNIGLVDIGAGALPGGNPVAISKDMAFHIDMVSNVTGAAVSYNGVSVADGSFDVWVDGVRVIAGGNIHQGSVPATLDGFGLWMNNGSTVNSPVDSIYVDNLAWHDMAFVQAVPEPGVVGLASFVLCGLVARRRRRV